MTTKTAKTEPDAPQPEAVVRVIGPALGRWRIARKFGPEATEIPLAELTEDQIAALKADPLLTVVGA